MTHALQNDAGSAYVVTLLVMSITLALGMALVTAGVTELDISGNYRNRLPPTTRRTPESKNDR